MLLLCAVSRIWISWSRRNFSGETRYRDCYALVVQKRNILRPRPASKNLKSLKQKEIQTICNPYFVWSGTLKSGTSYWSPYLNSGTFNLTGACGSGYCASTNAFGVRCVPDLKNPTDTCPGSYDNNCWPNHVWSGTLRATSYYSGFQLNSGAFGMTGACDGTGKCNSTNAFTVRCVLDLIFLKWKIF